MGLAEFLSIIWRSKWIILVTAIATTAFITTATIRQPTVYEAGSVLVVGNLSSGKALGSTGGEDKLAASYADLLNIDDVFQASAEKSGLSLTSEQLRGHVTAVTANNSPYLRLTSSDTDAGRAVDEVNAMANGLASYVTNLQDKNLTKGREAIQGQLTEIEKQIDAIPENDTQQAGQLGALNAVRDSLTKQNEQYITDTTYSRLSVVSLANTASPQVPAKTRNISLGLLVGVLVGVAIGFVYHSSLKALREEQ